MAALVATATPVQAAPSGASKSIDSTAAVSSTKLAAALAVADSVSEIPWHTRPSQSNQFFHGKLPKKPSLENELEILTSLDVFRKAQVGLPSSSGCDRLRYKQNAELLANFLLHAYIPSLERFTHMFCRNRVRGPIVGIDAEELFAEGLVKVHDAIHAFRLTPTTDRPKAPTKSHFFKYASKTVGRAMNRYQEPRDRWLQRSRGFEGDLADLCAPDYRLVFERAHDLSVLKHRLHGFFTDRTNSCFTPKEKKAGTLLFLKMVSPREVANRMRVTDSRVYALRDGILKKLQPLLKRAEV